MAQRLSGRFVAKPMAAINMTPMVPALLAVLVVAMVSSTPSLDSSRRLRLSGINRAFPPPARRTARKRMTDLTRSRR
jgi:biopolymer transport protein ExbD